MTASCIVGFFRGSLDLLSRVWKVEVWKDRLSLNSSKILAVSSTCFRWNCILLCVGGIVAAVFVFFDYVRAQCASRNATC